MSIDEKKVDFWIRVFCASWEEGDKTLEQSREIADLALFYFNNTNWNVKKIRESK
jgi:hypothetical protein